MELVVESGLKIRTELGEGSSSPPFLSIVTRCYQRPEMLAVNRQSLKDQVDKDYEHICLIDEMGIGVAGANRALAEVEPAGRYVMVLDDDDLLTNRWAITLLKGATVTNPDMVIFKAHHNGLGILPSPTVWKYQRPILGQIGSCDFITRRDVWDKHIHRFGVDSCGDYAFLHSIWFDRPKVIWKDVQLAAVQRISWGKPE